MSLDQVLKAVAQIKKELGAVTKSADNPFFKSKYADLNSYLDAVEPLLEKNGVVLLQPVSSDELGNYVSSQLIHVDSGEMVESKMRLVGEVDMQKVGSAVTYARRYTLGSLLSMKAEDDDGNAASGKAKTKTTAPKTTTTGKSSSFRKPKAKSVASAVGDDI